MTSDNDRIRALWQLADETGERVPLGRLVFCDRCMENYTDSEESGGFVFGNEGICPRCAPRFMAIVKREREEMYVRARCVPGVAFADFIRAYRGEDAYIQITNKDNGTGSQH